MRKIELAQLYSPTLRPVSALNRLMSWIRGCRPLYDALLATGYRPSQRHFTPQQVKLIEEYLGAA